VTGGPATGGAGPPGGARAAMTVEELLLLHLLAAVGGVAALGVLAWAAGQVAGWVAHGAWPRVPVGEAFGIATRLPAHLGDPRQAWPAPVRDQLAGPVVFYTLAVGLLALPVAATVVVAAYAGGRSRGRRRRERDRSPSWASARQVRHLLVRHPDRDARGRVVLGRLGRSRGGPVVAAEARRSVMVIAPTQAGKTTRFVIPTVLRWHGPLLVTSVKSDVLRLTLAERSRRGAVHVFDPTASTGLPTCKVEPAAGLPRLPGRRAHRDLAGGGGRGGPPGGQRPVLGVPGREAARPAAVRRRGQRRRRPAGRLLGRPAGHRRGHRGAGVARRPGRPRRVGRHLR